MERTAFPLPIFVCVTPVRPNEELIPREAVPSKPFGHNGFSDTACTFCGREGELLMAQTRFSTAITYISHPCAVCASWWPRAHADVLYVRTGPPTRQAGNQ